MKATLTMDLPEATVTADVDVREDTSRLLILHMLVLKLQSALRQVLADEAVNAPDRKAAV